MRVLAISAHADDETFGCGGTLLKHRARGDEIHWLIASARAQPRWSASEVATHEQQISSVAVGYDVSRVERLGHPDAQLETVGLAALIEGIDGVLADIRPEIVYVVHGGDAHSDHAIVHRATMSALKAFRMGLLGVRRVLAFETLSSTDAAVQDARHAFLPTVFSDITGHLDGKCALVRLYGSELQPPLMPRTESAVTALARVRGASVGVEYAEAFVLLRELA